MQKSYFIYALCHPITKDVRYIGKTTDINRRYYHHCSTLKKQNNKRVAWLRSLKNQGLRPGLFVLEEVENNWQFEEQFWISMFKSWGFNLTNLTDGGDGMLGNKKSEETKLKISINNAKSSEKCVYKFNLNGGFIIDYKSATQASIENNIPLGRITKCARGEQFTGGGFHWSYNKTFIKKPKRKYYGKRTDIHSWR